MDQLRPCSDCKRMLPASTEFFSRNRRRKDGLVLYCKRCAADRWQVHYRINREQLIARATESTKRRRECPEVRAAERQYARQRKRKVLADPVARAAHRKRAADWVKAHPERAKSFKHAQPALRAYRAAMRLVAVKRATPVWADREAIKAIYVEAARMTLKTGVPHQVDHIVPIAGRNVCGLHVPANLRVITADANRLKSNTLIEDLALAPLPPFPAT